MGIDRSNFPEVTAAFAEIECDNGGNLIGTFYPGEVISLTCFTVPPAWERLLKPAEAGLSRLRLTSEEDWQEFVCGEVGAADAIQERQGDLNDARRLLDDFFNGFPDKDGA